MNDNEIWAYDEPHESGGNCHITMTRRQAIGHHRKVYKTNWDRKFPNDATDSEIFFDWVALHWAYREGGENAQ